MPTLINIRPEAVNLDFYPGNPIVLTVNFPAGYLATRTIKSFLGGRASPGVEGTCVEATDTLTITFTGAQTTAVTSSIDGPMVWEMSIYTVGPPVVYEVLLTGIWTPGTDGSNGPSAIEFTAEIAPSTTVTVQAVAITSTLPTGGTDGQVLTKTSATDYAVAWETLPSAFSLSSTAGKWTDVASPLAITANIATLLGENIMDGEDPAVTGIAWEDANDGFRITNAGLYTVKGIALLDSNAIATGQATLSITGTVSVEQPDIPYGSGADMTLRFDSMVWVPASGLLSLTLLSSQNVNVTNAEFYMQRVTAVGA